MADGLMNAAQVQSIYDGLEDANKRLATGKEVVDMRAWISVQALLDERTRLMILRENEPRAIMQTHGWDEDDRTSGFFVLANHELARARRKHGPMHSHHEAYAVLLEELQEVWDEVRKQQADPQHIIVELIQVAAMCARWAEDVCGALPPTDERGR